MAGNSRWIGAASIADGSRGAVFAEAAGRPPTMLMLLTFDQPFPAYSDDRGFGGDGLHDYEAFDQLCGLAKELFGCPTAIVSLLPASEGEKEGRRPEGLDANFAEEILATEAPLVISDTRADPRFAHVFLVTAYPFVRFYAGAPILVRGDELAGVFSIMDYRPRTDFGEQSLALLEGLARLAAGEVERRLAVHARMREAIQLDRLADGARAALAEIDDSGKIVRVNVAMETLTGVGAHKLEGAPAARFLPGWEQVARQSRLFLHGEAQTTPYALLDVIAADGTPVPARAYPTPLFERGRTFCRLVLEPID
jgi:PAS domain S-box-containing protein